MTMVNGVGQMVRTVLDDGACPVPGTPHKYSYDGEGRLVSVGYGQTVYTYDAEGNRVAQPRLTAR